MNSKPYTIYISSRGIAPEHDYKWLRISQDDSQPHCDETPRCLDTQLTGLLQSDAASVLLHRRDDQYVLLLTAFHSSRKDAQGRAIRASMVLHADLSEEKLIRGVAASALNDDIRPQLEQVLNESIYNDNKTGFAVTPDIYEEIRQFIAPEPQYKPKYQSVYYPNTTQNRQQIALFLKQNSLLNYFGPLILVTGVLSSTKLKNSKSWLGASRLISTPITTPLREVRSKTKKRLGALRNWMSAVLKLLQKAHKPINQTSQGYKHPILGGPLDCSNKQITSGKP